MKWLDKFADYMVLAETGFKVIAVGFINFFTFVFAGLVYFIPIDLTWKTIGKGPSILLGALCLFIYSLFFAFLMIQGCRCRKCSGENKDEN